MKCLESLSYSNCNDALLGDLVPILCQLLLSRRADSSTALVLRVLCNMVANDCYDSRALECGLVPCMLLFLPQHKVEVELQAARDTQCLALRVLSSLSSSPAFDSVFCSSGMTQVVAVHKKITSCTLVTAPSGAQQLLSSGREGVVRARLAHFAQHEHPQRVRLPTRCIFHSSVFLFCN